MFPSEQFHQRRHMYARHMYARAKESHPLAAGAKLSIPILLSAAATRKRGARGRRFPSAVVAANRRWPCPKILGAWLASPVAGFYPSRLFLRCVAVSGASEFRVGNMFFHKSSVLFWRGVEDSREKL